ncbi:MAG: DUF2666 domain-containing protein [Candidatus Diapherotrites archaeon]|nr:DUF2666 domain-containing protein [Candidatus Diapherotrites archaeon]
MGAEGVQLIANLDNWSCVKKLKIEKDMQPREVAEFLISLNMSVNKKSEDFLSKDIDFSIIKNAVDSCACEATKLLENQALKKAIKDSIKNRAAYDNNSLKVLEELASIFAVRYFLQKAGLKIDYYEAELPSLKLARKLSKKVK